MAINLIRCAATPSFIDIFNTTEIVYENANETLRRAFT